MSSRGSRHRSLLPDVECSPQERQILLGVLGLLVLGIAVRFWHMVF